MHPIRKAAQVAYDAAVKAARAAEDVSEEAYLAAKAELDARRRELVALELEYPTPAEAKRAANLLRLRNRGLDV